MAFWWSMTQHRDELTVFAALATCRQFRRQYIGSIRPYAKKLKSAKWPRPCLNAGKRFWNGRLEIQLGLGAILPHRVPATAPRRKPGKTISPLTTTASDRDELIHLADARDRSWALAQPLTGLVHVASRVGGFGWTCSSRSGSPLKARMNARQRLTCHRCTIIPS